MEAIVDMAPEVITTMKPRAGANKHTAREPLRTVVAVGGAAIRSNIIVPVGTFRSDPNVDADLSCGLGTGDKYHAGHKSEQYKYLEYAHSFTSNEVSLGGRNSLELYRSWRDLQR
jgi:hypothetical protein